MIGFTQGMIREFARIMGYERKDTIRAPLTTGLQGNKHRVKCKRDRSLKNRANRRKAKRRVK